MLLFCITSIMARLVLALSSLLLVVCSDPTVYLREDFAGNLEVLQPCNLQGICISVNSFPFL